MKGVLINSFQLNLNDLLSDKNINRVGLSKILKISTSTIDGYLTKNYYPHIKIAQRMANYFNCSLDYLLGLTETPDVKIKISNKSFYENYMFLINKNKTNSSRVLNDLYMARSNIYYWKKGINPKTQNLIEIAKYFGTTIEFLMGRTDVY